MPVDLEALEININDIVISNPFKAFLPATHKIAKCYAHYKKNGVFDRNIVLDKNNELIDGYVAYLVAKMLGIKIVFAEKLSTKE